MINKNWGIPVSLLICFFSACNKKDMVRSTVANMMVVNASPNAGSIELLQNLKPLGLFPYTRGINPSVKYFTVDSGFNNYKIKRGADELQNTLFSNTGFYFSYFIYDTITTGSIKAFFLRDEVDSTGFGTKCKYRFLQLSPGLDSIDILTPSIANGSDSIILSSLYFGKFNADIIYQSVGFQNFLTGNRTLRIKRKVDGSIIKTYQFNFEKGGIYSLILKGYDGRNTSDSLSLSIIRHN